MRNLIEECRRVLRIHSVSAEGNEEISNHIVTLLQDRGLKTALQPVTHSVENVSKRQFNVIGILGDPLVDKKTRKGLLLQARLDTPEPGIAANWTETGGDPFAPFLQEGRMVALGAVAGKIDMLCRIQAVERFRERKLRQPVYLVGTCGSELGMFGSRYLIKSLALNPKAVLTSEPTAIRIGRAHKAAALYRVEVRYQMIERDARGFNRRVELKSFGRTAHGGHPDLGVNAILQATDFLRAASESGFEMRYLRFAGGGLSRSQVPDEATVEFFLTSHQQEDFKRFFREMTRVEGREKAFQLTFGGTGETGVRFLPDPVFGSVTEIVHFFRRLGQELREERDARFEVPHATVNFSGIRQSHGGIDLHFDVRWLPSQPVAELEKVIHAGVREFASKYPSLNVTVHRERWINGLQVSEDSDWVGQMKEAMTSAGLESVVHEASGPTEAALWKEAGYDALFFGPGFSGGNSHGPNEGILIDQIERAVQFYEKLIERVCL